MKKFADYYPLVMRISLTFVFLWFGLSEIFDPRYFSGYVPEMAKNLLPIPLLPLIQGHGVILVVLAICLILNFYIRYVSLISVLVLLSIIGGLISINGFDEIVVRDIGLFGLSVSIWLQSLKNK